MSFPCLLFACIIYCIFHFQSGGYFGLKECAHFPHSLLGSAVQPIDLSADDDDALVVSPIAIHADFDNSEAAAPPDEEVNPLAMVLYQGDGAVDNVNGGGLSDEFFSFASMKPWY
ncbi:hypothetical protein ACJIZ3_014941 [Penstemon smallii]|uniref:Uncharacterized protein n=1 Tax=Penstemon smallii TaxID=265156 RepID=A0ABD3RLB6_9LAMI